MDGGIVSIASYRPRPGCHDLLVNVLDNYLHLLTVAGHAHEKPSYLMKAVDGSVLQVFEWKSLNAKQLAHESNEIMDMVRNITEIADIMNLADLTEANQPYAHFVAIHI